MAQLKRIIVCVALFGGLVMGGHGLFNIYNSIFAKGVAGAQKDLNNIIQLVPFREGARTIPIQCLPDDDLTVPNLYRNIEGKLCQINSSIVYFPDFGFLLMTRVLIHPPQGFYTCSFIDKYGIAAENVYHLISDSGVPGPPPEHRPGHSRKFIGEGDQAICYTQPTEIPPYCNMYRHMMSTCRTETLLEIVLGVVKVAGYGKKIERHFEDLTAMKETVDETLNSIQHFLDKI